MVAGVEYFCRGSQVQVPKPVELNHDVEDALHLVRRPGATERQPLEVRRGGHEPKIRATHSWSDFGTGVALAIGRDFSERVLGPAK